MLNLGIYQRKHSATVQAHFLHTIDDLQFVAEKYRGRVSGETLLIPTLEGTQQFELGEYFVHDANADVFQSLSKEAFEDQYERRTR